MIFSVQLLLFYSISFKINPSSGILPLANSFVKFLWAGVALLALLFIIALSLETRRQHTEEENAHAFQERLEEIQQTRYTEEISDALASAPSLSVEAIERETPLPAEVKPRLVLVIDDLGINVQMTERLLSLSGGPYVFAFLPYAQSKKLKIWTDAAYGHGHEIILHLPMEPENPNINPGPNALRLEHSSEMIIQRLRWALGRVDHIAGINNHMGSAFSHWPIGVDVVMQEISGEGLYFMDSLTHPASIIPNSAHRHDIDVVTRDVFIDHDPQEDSIRGQLRQFEKIALKRGYAIAIAHPYPETWQVLKEWIPETLEKGFEFVTISQLIEIQKK